MPTTTGGRPLVVGTNGASPPYAFLRDGRFVGLEIDFARELEHDLGRPVQLVDLPFEDLLNALERGRVDVVMAGVTVTRDREVRFAFADPYLRTSLAAVVRRQDAGRFTSRASVCDSPINAGVVSGTTGEKRLRSQCPTMIPRLYPTAPDAVRELTQYRVDAVVHDAPVLTWIASENEAELQFVRLDGEGEPLAWAFRSDARDLRDQANASLVRMRNDGTLERILSQWIPSTARGR
jgi:polar amino acid transport system substrate-binding protein